MLDYSEPLNSNQCLRRFPTVWMPMNSAVPTAGILQKFLASLCVFRNAQIQIEREGPMSPICGRWKTSPWVQRYVCFVVIYHVLYKISKGSKTRWKQHDNKTWTEWIRAHFHRFTWQQNLARVNADPRSPLCSFQALPRPEESNFPEFSKTATQAMTMYHAR